MKQKNRCRMRDWRFFLKSRVFGRRIDEAQNVKTVTCVSERRVNFKSTWGVWSGCVRRDFGKTLLRYLCTKARGTSLWPKLQLWHQSVSASVVNPTAFLPLHTSQCTSGDDTCAFATRSLARTGRYVLPASAGFVATSTRCTMSVFSYVTVRGRRLWRRNVFNLSSPTLHVREIPFLVSHATFPPFPYTYRHRARTSRSITPSTRVAWTRMQLLLFVLRFLPK